MKSHTLMLLCIVVFGVLGTCQRGSLRKNYYKVSCPDAEKGCDASVLLNSTSNNIAEKQAIPNLTLKGFNVIDDIKAKVEKKCA
ncbi:hypothetical protein REPUB_Repub12eG0126800 [Reevesia pubescens]